jgi:hypothetical protein
MNSSRFSHSTCLALLLGCLATSCAQSHRPPERPVASTTQPANVHSLQDWFGVYASPKEISGFSGTALVLEKNSSNDIDYRMRSYSDVSSADAIPQDERCGSCLIDGNVMYVPEADGFMLEGKPRLLASVTRYTLVEINRRKVLMRDDALQAYREQDKLYDYGILIKVDEQRKGEVDLRKVEHPSIKLLYSDPTKPWRDPFVNGANPR